MTETDLATLVRALGPVMREYVTKAMSDLTPRLAAVEATLAVLGDVRDRVIAVETKAAQPVVISPVEVPAAPVDLSPILERVAAAEARLAVLGDLRDRVVVVETKAAQAIPAPAVVDVPPPIDLMPVLERIAACEWKLTTLGDLRDRVVTVETKAAQPLPAVDFGDVRDRLSAVELKLDLKTAEMTPVLATVSDLIKDVGALRERVAVVEVRPPIPGPKGDPGDPGTNGKDGEPGTPGLSFQGVYQDGKSYELGNLVTWGGSSWHCNQPTTTKPGEGSKDWTLMVKRGRDGKDGVDATGALPVVAVGRR